MKSIKLFVLLLLQTSLFFAQEINQMDANGMRHGIWKKTFEGSNILRYEGEFFHGKEIGLFKFYKNLKNKAVLTASKAFNKNDSKAYVTFFASTGKVISEGTMDGKLYIGAWKYYQKDTDNLLTLEYYDASGNLDGERIVYYPNGEIAEKQFYKAGKLEGVSKVFSDKNVLLSEVVYVNGDLHGYSNYFSPTGELVAEGIYKNGKKEGIWKYYENGKLTEEKNLSAIPKSIKKTP